VKKETNAMTIVRWHAGRDVPAFPGDVLSMQREINRMFDSFFREGTTNGVDLFPSAWVPAADLLEHDDKCILRMDLPGLDRHDVKITLQDSVLTIRGEKKQEKETQDAHAHRLERSSGSFQRSFTLPSGVRNDGVEATFKDGILTVTLPKREDARQQKVDVKVR
jgi:HSP20 family protein